ncbi:MAG: phosphoadenosine phosphosulfate reductase family protein [Nitrospirota bacterium]|nr:phosphoadenosine phosphosulfate reductase family protein [Nitrospirota bacterium]
MNLFDKYEEANEAAALDSSRSIFDEAVARFAPKKVCVMFSGGDDSLVTLYVAKELGFKIDYIIHANTGTGVKDTRDFVGAEVAKFPAAQFIETFPKKENTIEATVARAGFYRNGKKAHQMSYNNLKGKPFRAAISKHIRHRRHKYPILLLNGARKSESARRAITCKDPYNVQKGGNVWVNLINDWSKEDCLKFLKDRGIARNPVSIKLGRSGECNCGTTAKRSELFELRDKGYIDTYNQIKELEEIAAAAGFGWKWAQKCPRNKTREHLEAAGQLSAFMPMCTGCEFRSSSKSCDI